MSKINLDLQEPQHNRNATANFVNLIMTSTVYFDLYLCTCMQANIMRVYIGQAQDPAKDNQL